jgi:lipid-binding SYLF domain-containing protein
MFVSGCTTTGPSSGDPDLRRRSIDAEVDCVLSNRGLLAGITLDGTRITRLDL